MYTPKKAYFYGTGRRKSSIARVRLIPGGTGVITVNGRTLDNYFGISPLMARELACRAAGVDALDIVFSDINDEEGLRDDAALAKNLGVEGKTVVHPRQIDIVNSYFTPSMKEIKYALRVLDAVEKGKKEGKGAVTLDGGMIDKPMELRALTTLAQAKAAGIKTEGLVI